jgi:hypothetical protein
VYTKSSLGQYSDNAIATNVSNSTECEYISVWNESSAILERVCIDTQLPSPRMIQQIDFAATMSILSGVPIPFTSIGMIIPELMTNSFCDSSSEDSCDDIGTALLVNALQVCMYTSIMMLICLFNFTAMGLFLFPGHAICGALLLPI